MQAYGEFIIVRNDMNKEEKVGSIIVEQENTNAVNNGTVISVGDLVNSDVEQYVSSGLEVTSEAVEIKEGDTIWFSNVVCQIGTKDKKLIAVRKKDIIAIGE